MNEIVLVCECGSKHKVTSYTICIVCMVCKKKYNFEGHPSENNDNQNENTNCEV